MKIRKEKGGAGGIFNVKKWREREHMYAYESLP